MAPRNTAAPTSDADRFLAFLEATFGAETTILKHECPHGGPPVHVFVFDDVPQKGRLTGVTFGLSRVAHPNWKKARPELFISVDSRDRGWAFAAAYFAAEFRGIKPFCYGDVFTTDTPLAEDSNMDGLLVFTQSLLSPKAAQIALNEYTVSFSQLYPIYRSELPIYQTIGLERFWKHEGFDMYDVHRPPITQGLARKRRRPKGG